MNIVFIINWILNIIMFVMIIKSILLRRKTKKIIKDFEIISEEMIKNYSDRLNLLSKENNKLREENEEMKERLRNLGIKDFDVMK